MNQINGLLGCYEIRLLHDGFAKYERTICYSIHQNSHPSQMNSQSFRILRSKYPYEIRVDFSSQLHSKN